MWNIAIPAICVIAHLYLVVLFLPAFWREIDARGWRWHNTVTSVVVPLIVAALIAGHASRNLAQLPDWLLVVAFIAIDALVVSVVLALVGLRAHRRRTA